MVIISFVVFHVYSSNLISHFFMIYLSKKKKKEGDCHDIYIHLKDRLVNDMVVQVNQLWNVLKSNVHDLPSN